MLLLYVYYPVCVIQDCVIYLCGTKCDLVEENKKARKVDLHLTKEYADGKSVPNIRTVAIALFCRRNCSKVYRDIGKDGL